MTYTIRKTIFSDIGHLGEIERSASVIFKSISDFEWIADADVISEQEHRRFANSGLSWVALETESLAILGFILTEIINGDLYIAEISVSQAHQQKSIGSKLIHVALKEAMALGLNSATLTTFIDVPWNAPYYERLGFVILKGESVPSYLMKKLQEEGQAGLPFERRCAMRKMF